ncbi:hypothetical protein JOC74_004667 [Bacillus capparidis]|uniref:Uncharacterized protein n=1 Tax=Bacillus capparidis TaxID=1840411 RepID=A0ABS4D3C8_9BACI|nr:hypothetical protein [Bacillus capparidis]
MIEIEKPKIETVFCTNSQQSKALLKMLHRSS